MKKDKPLNGTTATAGGIAFIFPKKWSSVEVEFKSSHDHLEALALILLPPNSKPIKVATCYNRPGNHLPESLLQEFNDIRLNGINLPGLFVGDFNSPHLAFGSRQTNTYGSSLLQIINKNNLIVFNSQSPTYFCNSSGEPNLLDLVLGNDLMSPYILSCDVEGDVGSDHFPVKTLLDFNTSNANIRQKLNFGQWVRRIDETLPNLKVDSLHIDDQIEAVERVFQTLHKECKHKVRRPKRKLPQNIMETIKYRKRLLKERQHASSQDERAKITKEFNRVNKDVKQLIQDHEELERESLASDICQARDTNAMWRLFQKFKSRNKESDKPNVPLKLSNGNWTISNEEKSSEFARHLSQVHQTPDNPAFDINFKNEIDTYITNYITPPACENAINQIDVKKFRQVLSQTKSNSSPGEDLISYDVMKKCSDKSLEVLCKLINHCLAKNVFPSRWKYAQIKMLVKPGKDPRTPTGYRPISLISCLGKIYERYVCEHLVQKLTEKKYLADVQAGYQKGKSSQEHLFRLAQDVFNGFKERKCTIGIFSDVHKAFDAVWINGLKLKIKNIGLPTQLQNILFSFLTDRFLKVNVDGSVSNSVRLEAGTPQGSCLSPILYLIFVNDLTSTVDRKYTSVSQYADDVNLYCTDRSAKVAEIHLQNALDNVIQWCRKWQVQMNAGKSQVVMFSKCPTHRNEDVNLKMFGQTIPTGNEATYLGVIFDSRLTWEHHINNISQRAYGRLNILRAMASLSKKHNPSLLTQLYNTTTRSIFEYSSVCIISSANTHLQKLQVIQNEALRIILKVPAYVPIAKMNDAGNQQNIKEHLIAVAKNRIERLCEASSLVKETVDNFKKLKSNNFNTSPLDAIKS